MKTPFLTMLPEEVLPTKIYLDYDGPVPPKVSAYFCDRILGCAADRLFWPTDPMDAYGQLWLDLELTAQNLPTLKTATSATYLRRTVDNLIRRYFTRVVRPVREEYRQTEGCLHQADADNCEIDEEEVPLLTARNLSDRLAGKPGARERRDAAALELELIYARLRINLPRAKKPERIVCAFRAYVATDGNMFAAAARANMGRAWFYRCWPKWLALARKIVEKSAAVRH